VLLEAEKHGYIKRVAVRLEEGRKGNCRIYNCLTPTNRKKIVQLAKELN
jgi:hypothetical protein